MNRRLLTGNAAAAWGARLAAVDYVPAFPITPQTEIIESIAEWIGRGEMDARMVMLESEHSMVTAAAAAAATGVRVFTATSSQGLLYAMEMLYTVAGWRAPFVLVNVSRGLASPITLEADHDDVFAARDSGFLQLHCATCQEVVDSVLIAHRLGEHPEVRLPVIVNLDGFTLSFTREPVDLPDAGAARRFLPDYAPDGGFRASAPLSQAVAVLGGSPYSYFRYEQHLAALRAGEVHAQVAGEFEGVFGRAYPALECHRCDDAEYVFVMTGAMSTKAKQAVEQLREAGKRVGLVRPRLYRPLPADALRRALRGKRGVAVLDQDISMGMGGVLHAELGSALCGMPDAPLLASFIGGLGGRDISPGEFAEMIAATEAAVAMGAPPQPRLLYTAAELREMRKLQAIALIERHESMGGGTAP